MRIKKIYVSAFGSLKDYTLTLSDGFQIIYGENEAGKTTLTEFIKSMFYGTGRRAAGQSVSIREKYTPFDGTPAGGRVFFEHSGKDYCLERQFRKSDATDKITLTDIASGKSEPVPSDIGKSLFGITMPAFERSVFIGNTPDFSFDGGAAHKFRPYGGRRRFISKNSQQNWRCAAIPYLKIGQNRKPCG